MNYNLWTTFKSITRNNIISSILHCVAAGPGQLFAATPRPIVRCQLCPDWRPGVPEISIMVSGDNILWSLLVTPPHVSVTLWRIKQLSPSHNCHKYISHFFSGAIAETRLGTGQVFDGEGVVINIEDGHQKKALSNLWHKKVFLLHDCSWLLWMPLHLMIAWHWLIIKWKVPSLMESWIKKVKEESGRRFFQPCFILPTWRAVNRIQTTNQKNLTITISFVKTMPRTCRGRGLNTSAWLRVASVWRSHPHHEI